MQMYSKCSTVDSTSPVKHTNTPVNAGVNAGRLTICRQSPAHRAVKGALPSPCRPPGGEGVSSRAGLDIYKCIRPKFEIPQKDSL